MQNIKNIISITIALIVLAAIISVAFLGFIALFGLAIIIAIGIYIQNILRSKTSQNNNINDETNSSSNKITIIEGEVIKKDN